MNISLIFLVLLLILGAVFAEDLYVLILYLKLQYTRFHIWLFYRSKVGRALFYTAHFLAIMKIRLQTRLKILQIRLQGYKCRVQLYLYFRGFRKKFPELPEYIKPKDPSR